MAVKLVDFARKLIKERKIIRANKGNSIVPLFIIRFTGMPQERLGYFAGPGSNVVLLTVCRRTGSVFSNKDLTKLYSGTAYVGYTDWWAWSDVISIRPPGVTSTNKLLEINIQYKDRADDWIDD